MFYDSLVTNQVQFIVLFLIDAMDKQPVYGAKTKDLHRKAHAMAATMLAPGGHEKFPLPPDER